MDSASILSDIYAMQGMKIFLSGADSLGFWIAEANELYDRSCMIHTTYIPFREYSRLLGIDDIDEYIRYGGTLLPAGTDFDDSDVLEETAPFRDEESARRYIDTAVCLNIQHSLECCRDRRYFRHLIHLYDAGKLTNAIQRIIESMNHQFLLRTLTAKFKSHDLSPAAQLLHKQTDPEKQTDILDKMDREAITRKLMEMLETRNREDQKLGITKEQVAEIMEYLKALDLAVDCPSETTILGAEPLSYMLFTQPGMRYCQAEALVHVLMKDELFRPFTEWEKKLFADKLLEDVRGRMMGDMVLLDRAKTLPKSKRAFKLFLNRREVDMAIYDTLENTCEEYAVKHSVDRVKEQARALLDPEVSKEVEAKYGKIIKRCVIYRGETGREGEVEYVNIQEYLKAL